MKLEETRTIADLDKFIASEPAKIGKPMVLNIVKRSIAIASFDMKMLLEPLYQQYIFKAYCEGKIGTPEELKERYNAWVSKEFAPKAENI